MLGNRVKVTREDVEPIEGTLQSLKPEGVVVTPDGYGYPPPRDVFVPMQRVIQIEDLGRVNR